MKMHELFKEPASWCQFEMGRVGQHGPSRAPRDPDCTCRCLTGGVIFCYDDSKRDEAYAKLMLALDKDNIIGLQLWNDDQDRTHSEIYTLCKELDI